ncbi:MAG: type I glyceraldehyde-3-phosphate dehydrogenase [Bacteroidales bacterium]|jgi:glyceraldehyde 3-phosphate dehydrogenase
MAKIKLAINGFGRIGRAVARIAMERDNIDLVGINSGTDTKMYAHLFKYDSTQGTWDGDIKYTESSLIINGHEVPVTGERTPLNIKWATQPDVVVEATGKFRKFESESGGYGDLLKTGAKKILLTVPAKDDNAKMIVMGVNDDQITADDICVSNASCTTNCIAPVVKVLEEKFGVVQGLMTTVHAYTLDQRILDGSHKDYRRARAAAMSIIPTTTGAAKSVGKVIPSLKGKLDGMAMRVPVPTGSIVDLNVELKKEVTIEDINSAMEEASRTNLQGILGYTEDPIVSCDIIHDPLSSIFDAGLTMVMPDKRHAKVCAWYDNEWAYSVRVLDLVEKMFSF